MFTTWGELIAYLREAEGFKGQANLANVEKFCADNGIELKFASGATVKSLYAAKEKADKARSDAAVAVADEPEPDAEPSAADRLNARRASASAGKAQGALGRQFADDDSGKGGWSPAAHRRMIERKQYDAQASDRWARKRRGSFSCAEAAEGFGAWVRRNLPGGDVSTADDREILKSFGLDERTYNASRGEKAGSSTNNTLGGALVPAEFLPELISLQEKYGVFRANSRVIPMNRDVMQIPRRTGHLTVYQAGQNNAITDSDITFNDVQLTAQEWGCLNKQPMSLIEDSAINLGDTVANDMAYAFALQEDQCGFNGDGSQTYFGNVGIKKSITNVTATQANIASLVISANNSWGAITIGEFEQAVGTVPYYAWSMGGGVAWYCSQTFYWTVMRKLELAQGGVTATETRDGVPQPMFLGVPVIITQVMPQVTAVTAVQAIIGNLSLGTKFGDRKSIEIKASDQVGFANNQMYFRAIQRVAFAVHEVGNSSATASLRVAGPIIALATI